MLFALLLTGCFASIFIMNIGVNAVLEKLPLERQFLPQLSWGWLVYFLIFWIARSLGVATTIVQVIYTALAVLVPLVAIAVFWRFRAKRPWPRFPIQSKTIVAVGLFVIVMAVVGPYLEFPADPIVHLQRIQAWEKVPQMDYASGSKTYSRFAYFFQHWLLQSTQISWGDRTGLFVLTPILQGLLFYQFIRLTCLFTGSATLGILGGLMSLGYFGFSGFSFYRYVALSGALVAFICCLDGFILIVGAFLKEQIRYLLLLPPILFFTWGNHPQETLLQLSAIAGLSLTLFVFRYRDFSKPFRTWMLASNIGLLALTVLVLIVKPPSPLNVNNRHRELLLDGITKLGGIEIYHHSLDYLTTMVGIVGWLAVLGALVCLLFNRPDRPFDIAAALCVWPFVVLLNPLGIAVLERFLLLDVFHRLIYGSLFWVFIVVCCQRAVQQFTSSTLAPGRVSQRLSARSSGLFIGILGLFIALAWVPVHPIQGKLQHLFVRVDENLDGRDVRPAIAFLRENALAHCRDPQPEAALSPIRSVILSDPYTNTYLAGTGYFYTATSRWNRTPGFEAMRMPVSTSMTTVNFGDDLLSTLREQQVCYIVVHQQAGKVDSLMGQIVGHWDTDYANTTNYYSEAFLTAVRDRPDQFVPVFENETTTVYQVVE